MIIVSVIVVSYNSSNTIATCLKALSCQTFRAFKIILLDNNSSDDTLEKVYSVRQDIALPMVIVESKVNQGFAQGNNEAYKKADTEYVALLNPDVIVGPNWLEELVQEMNTDENVGICASKMLKDGEGNTIDSAGDGFSRILRGFKRGEGDVSSSFDRKKYVLEPVLVQRCIAQS